MTAKTAIDGIPGNRARGTYIRPLIGAYEFGRWAREVTPDGDHVRFDCLGHRSTPEQCREAFESFDKATERRVKELNRKRRRG